MKLYPLLLSVFPFFSSTIAMESNPTLIKIAGIITFNKPLTVAVIKGNSTTRLRKFSIKPEDPSQYGLTPLSIFSEGKIVTYYDLEKNRYKAPHICQVLHKKYKDSKIGYLKYRNDIEKPSWDKLKITLPTNQTTIYTPAALGYTGTILLYVNEFPVLQIREL